MNTKYYAIIATQTDLLKNETLEEIFRERTNQKVSQQKNPDFWAVNLEDLSKFKELQNKFSQTYYYKSKNINKFDKNNSDNYYVAFITNDKIFHDWLELRIGYFESLDEREFVSNQTYKSNGVKVSFEIGDIIFDKLIKIKNNIIDPSIIKNCLNIIDDSYLKLINN